MFRWKSLSIPRFFGLDLKTNVIDVKDGFSLDLLNCYQNSIGEIAKRPGNQIMFDADESGSLPIDEIGAATLTSTKYYFKFVDGKFKYSTSRTGAVTTISPSPAISTTNLIWWAVLDNKLFFVDGTNVLRFFDGSAIRASSIYARPTVALTTAGGGTGFDYVYTVDNGLGESPAVSTALVNKGSAVSVVVTGNTGPQTLIAGDIVRIYSRATSVAAASKLVATYTWQAADVLAGNSTVATAAISDTQPQLYSELGIALNKTAVTGLQGITVHYGRLVGWSGSRVYNSKSSNPHSWPDDSAQKEAFVYGFGLGDGESIQACVSFLESMFVLKKTKIAVFGGVGPDDTGGNAYSFRRLETDGIGCVGPKSAKVVSNEKTSYLVFLSAQGFYATNGDRPQRIGENIETEVIGISEAQQTGSVAYIDQREGLYVCILGGNTTKKAWVLDVREDQGVRVGWFQWSGINAKCAYWDSDRLLFGTPQGFCASQRVAGTSSDFSDVSVEYLETSAVNTGTDVLTVSRSYQTGDPVVVRTNGTIPAGITANTTYYVIRVSATQIQLATSEALALAGTEIDITTTGAGTHSIVGAQAISAYYTTNWINFKSKAEVKKLGKLNVLMNATASSVNISIQSAYDWVESFQDEQSIAIGSADAWGALPWGVFVWGLGAIATPRNVAISRRKVRSIRYKFLNDTINQDFSLQGIDQNFDYLRNRGNFAA